nr:MAG TPA_asm: hypothetical protein [Caudoviricetes sp.]
MPVKWWGRMPLPVHVCNRGGRATLCRGYFRSLQRTS